MAKTKNRTELKKLYDLHAWVGFELALVMFVILFTGTVATVAYEIDWLVWEEVRSTTSANHGSFGSLLFGITEQTMHY